MTNPTSLLTTPAGLAFLVLATHLALADTHFWTGGGSDNNWTTAANWDIGTPTAGDGLYFNGGTRTTPVNDFPAGTSFNRIEFRPGAVDFTLSGNAIDLAGAVAVAVNASLTRTHVIDLAINMVNSFSNFSVSDNQLLIINGVITDTTFANVNKIGTGTLRLTNAANDFSSLTGGDGTVQITTGGALGDVIADVWGDSSDCTLEFVGSSDITVGRPFKNGSEKVGGGGPTKTGDGTFTSSLTGAARVIFNGSLATDPDPAVARIFTLAGTNTNDNEINGDLRDHNATGLNSLVKNDAGKWILSGGANTYTGTTTVNDGTLLVNGAYTGGTAYTVNGGVLGGSGSIAGAVSVQSGGTLAPGSSIESLVVADATFSDGATLAIELDSSAAAATAADLLVINSGLTGGVGALSLSGTVTLAVSDLASSPVALARGTTYTLIDYNGTWNNGSFTVGGDPLLDGDTFDVGPNAWRIDYDATSPGANFTGDHIGGTFVNITVVTSGLLIRVR